MQNPDALSVISSLDDDIAAAKSTAKKGSKAPAPAAAVKDLKWTGQQLKVLLAATPARKARKEWTDKLAGKRKSSGPQAVERAAEIFFSQDQGKSKAKPAAAAAAHRPAAYARNRYQPQFRRTAYSMYVDESDEGEGDPDFERMEEEEEEEEEDGDNHLAVLVAADLPYRDPIRHMRAVYVPVPARAPVAAAAPAAPAAPAAAAPFRVERGADGSEIIVVD